MKLKNPLLKTDKVVGYALLIVGLILIFLAIYWAYGAFTGGSAPMSIFSWEDQKIEISLRENQPPQYLEIPGEGISKAVDLGLWLMLMFFLASGGGRIANLGIKMIKVEGKA